MTNQQYRRPGLAPHSRVGWGGAMLVLLMAILIGMGKIGGVSAQDHAHYFPETGHYLQGPFLLFWQTQGGLEIFGYPITEQYQDQQSNRLVQYFERARFELAPDLHYVELGLIGVEVTEGRIFQKSLPIEETAEWRYFPQTEHIIQKQFKQFWERRGRERIFGFPLSEEISELFPDGKYRTVQYFERARFEYWPEFPEGRRVLLSALGRQLAPTGLQAPISATTPPGSLPQQWEQSITQSGTFLPENIHAAVTPDRGRPGEVFTFTAYGFDPNEAVGIWFTAPDYIPQESGLQARADSSGAIAPVSVKTEPEFSDGVWAIHARGMRSGKGAVGYVRLSRITHTPPGNPAQLGTLAHDALAKSEHTHMMPLLGPSGTLFTMMAGGFTPGERVTGWITHPNQQSTPIQDADIQLDQLGNAQMLVSSNQFADGIYTAVLKGTKSNTVRTAPFRVSGAYIAPPGTSRPPNSNGNVTPSEAVYGNVLQVRAEGMQPYEPVEFWITDPAGRYTLMRTNFAADEQGRVGYAPPLDMLADQDFTPGVYGFHFRGINSGTLSHSYATMQEPVKP